MISTVRLARSGIDTSRLGFGTSRLHYMRSGDRQRLLSSAVDLGIVHFDTAPAYGDGLAESALAKLLSGRRHRIVVVTKYGVPADPVMQALPAIAPAYRIGRGLARKIGLARSQLPELTGPRLIRSVEDSLRRLATDHIDILLLHEPTVARLGRSAELLEQLQRFKTKGTIRAFGLAGMWREISPILQGPARDLGLVLQTDESGWVTDTEPDITFGALSGGGQSYFQHGPDPSLAMERLTTALERRPQGVLLVSTTKPDNLQVLARAAEKV